jgi:hypothetical protein
MEISTIQQDLIYARAAEIKNGRVAQLAVLGFLVQELVPSHYGLTDHNPLHALGLVPGAALAQIFAGCAVIELATFNYTYNSNTPWNLGWGSKLLDGKSAEEVKSMQLKELTHCRAAMVAFVGMVVQTLIYDAPLLGGSF